MKAFLSLFLCAVFARSVVADYDVLLYLDVPNPKGIPTNWIAGVQVAGKDLPKPPWIRMTKEELSEHRASAQADYDAWELAMETAAKEAADTVKRTREQLIADTIGDLDLALSNWDTLTNAQQKAILRRLVVIVRAILKDELK